MKWTDAADIDGLPRFQFSLCEEAFFYLAKLLTIFFPASRLGHKSKGKKVGSVQKMRLVRYLLYLYCVSDGSGNDFKSRGTALNDGRTSKGKRVNTKSLLRH